MRSPRATRHRRGRSTLLVVADERGDGVCDRRGTTDHLELAGRRQGGVEDVQQDFRNVLAGDGTAADRLAEGDPSGRGRVGEATGPDDGPVEVAAAQVGVGLCLGAQIDLKHPTP